MEAASFGVGIGEDVADHPLCEADGCKGRYVRLGFRICCALDEVILAVQVLVEVFDSLEGIF